MIPQIGKSRKYHIPILPVRFLLLLSFAFRPLQTWGFEASVRPRSRGIRRKYTFKNYQDHGEMSVPLQFTKRSSAIAMTTTSLNLSFSGGDNEDNNKDEEGNISILYIIVSFVGIISSVIMLWSEVSVALTRCGPPLLPDFLEKSSYISVFIFASGSNLSRIIFGSSMAELILGDDDTSASSDDNKVPVLEVEKELFRLMELMIFWTVLGAFAVLAIQVWNGDAFADGSKMSGIDVRRCRLMNEF